VSIIGNTRLTVFPIRELIFREVPANEPKIATYKAKWDEEYRNAGGWTPVRGRSRSGAGQEIEQMCKDIYRLLTIDGYAADRSATKQRTTRFISSRRTEPASRSR